MIRISLPWMLELAANLDGLDRVVGGQPLQASFMDLFNANVSVAALFEQSIYSYYLRSSRDRGDVLRSAIDRVMKDYQMDKIITEYEAADIKNSRDQFRLVFLSEISTLPVFLVTRKENYDISSLIDDGAGLFPPSLLIKAPETSFDAMETGKALAYEMGTACGFHAFRVTESVVKRYWDEVSSKNPRPSLETLGNFAAEMNKGGFGEPKIVESIKQMARLHRNPIIHPEVILTNEEAIGIIGMARSVIGAMLSVLPDVPTTTGVVAAKP